LFGGLGSYPHPRFLFERLIGQAVGIDIDRRALVRFLSLQMSGEPLAAS
jgi:hypothetical protein